MAVFEAAAHLAELPTDALVVQVVVEDGWLRLATGPHRLGGWKLQHLTVERLSLYRFQITTGKGDRIILFPDDPTGFSEATGVTIDLTTRSRFGLGERVTEARLPR